MATALGAEGPGRRRPAAPNGQLGRTCMGWNPIVRLAPPRCQQVWVGSQPWKPWCMPGLWSALKPMVWAQVLTW